MINKHALRNLLASHLETTGKEIETYELSDNSSSGFCFEKRKGDKVYIVQLEFNGDGNVLKDVSVYVADIEEVRRNEKRFI